MQHIQHAIYCCSHDPNGEPNQPPQHRHRLFVVPTTTTTTIRTFIFVRKKGNMCACVCTHLHNFSAPNDKIRLSIFRHPDPLRNASIILSHIYIKSIFLLCKNYAYFSCSLEGRGNKFARQLRSFAEVAHKR